MGVVPEVVADGVNALLVPAGEPGPLAHTIERLLADPALGRRLGVAARELVERRLSGARVAEALAARYAGLVPRAGVKVSILCFDVSDNAAGRAHLLARLLDAHRDASRWWDPSTARASGSR